MAGCPRRSYPSRCALDQRDGPQRQARAGSRAPNPARMLAETRVAAQPSGPLLPAAPGDQKDPPVKLIISALALASALAVQGRQQPEGDVILIGPGQTGGNAYVTVVSDPTNTSYVEVSGVTASFGAANVWNGMVTSASQKLLVRLVATPYTGWITLHGGFASLGGGGGGGAVIELFGKTYSASGHMIFGAHPPGEPQATPGGSGPPVAVHSAFGGHDNGFVSMQSENWYTEVDDPRAEIWPAQATVPGQTHVHVPMPTIDGDMWVGTISGLADGDSVFIGRNQKMGYAPYPDHVIIRDATGCRLTAAQNTRFELFTLPENPTAPSQGVFIWRDHGVNYPETPVMWVGPGSWLYYED